MPSTPDLAPIVAEVAVPVSITGAFVGFTAQMGEWWDPMGHYTQELWLGHPADEASVLDVRFSEAPAGGTLVRVVHSGWTPASEEIRSTYTHWDGLLQRYAAHVS